MISYNDLRLLHISFAIISVSGFAWRGLLMLTDSPMLQQLWVRIAPHINDTFLRAAAIGLAVMSGQYPWTVPWLTAKIVGLLAYIGLGVVALRPRFSIGFEDLGGGAEKADEFEYSDQVAQHFHTRHQQFSIPNHEVMLRLPEAVAQMTEPMVSHDVIAFYLLAERVSKEVKVVMSGQEARRV